jgi:hypothetical protein
VFYGDDQEPRNDSHCGFEHVGDVTGYESYAVARVYLGIYAILCCEFSVSEE